MALVTFYFGMAPQQLVFGVTIMIKLHRLPLVWRMTSVTLLPVTPPVCVIQAMATNAGLRCLFIAITRVTQLAIHFFVFANEWEFGVFVMIEAGFFPTCLHMALLALTTQLSFVNIFFLMAAITIPGSLSIALSFLMA